ncbi:MAG: hypothetical protein LUO79_03775 [Methanomassiliicoccales archaeon]|nr:hypothetical protein [Methanomassiliicoccales archaeon]
MARERGDILPEIEGLVDLIFGLALSIGALILINTVPKDSTEILQDLLAFTYGFIILVFIWEEVTKEMLLFKVESTGMLRVTYILLFLVALEPYLFNLITQHTASNVDEIASMLYAADLASLMAVLAFFAQKIINGAGNTSPLVRKAYHEKRQVFVFQATVFIVSMLPVFWELSVGTTKLRFIIWILAPMIALIWGIGRRQREKRQTRIAPE